VGDGPAENADWATAPWDRHVMFGASALRVAPRWGLQLGIYFRGPRVSPWAIEFGPAGAGVRPRATRVEIHDHNAARWAPDPRHLVRPDCNDSRSVFARRSAGAKWAVGGAPA